MCLGAQDFEKCQPFILDLRRHFTSNAQPQCQVDRSMKDGDRAKAQITCPSSKVVHKESIVLTLFAQRLSNLNSPASAAPHGCSTRHLV